MAEMQRHRFRWLICCLLATCLLVAAATQRAWAEDEKAGDGEEGDAKVARIMEELFLGTVVYPQDQGELQISFGFFRGFEERRDWQLPLEIEYGVTDSFQLELELPIDLWHDEDLRSGVGHLGLGAYYNFYSNRETGSALGVGFSLGIPALQDDEFQTLLYEPFFVAYHAFDSFAVNYSAELTIEDPLAGGETEVGSELVLSVFHPMGRFVPILEIAAEIETDRTPVRLAPGLMWKLGDDGKELGISLPIGLNRDAPDLGVFVLLIIEFGGDDAEDDEEQQGPDAGRGLREAQRGQFQYR